MIIAPGTPNAVVYFVCLDADGNPATSEDHTTLTLSYLRTGAASPTPISLSAGTVGTHSDGGVKHVANGVYELGLPDAAVTFIVGVNHVLLTGSSSTQGVTVVPLLIELFNLSIVATNTNVTLLSDTLIGLVRAMVRSDAATSDETSVDKINEDFGAGAGDYDPAEESLQALAGDGVPGGASVTIPIEDQDGNPIADCRTWITSDADGDTLVDGPRFTDDNGEVTFTLLAGNTYFLWAKKAGQMAVNGQAFTALAD